MAGFVGFSLHGKRGDSITIKHAEEIQLLSNGEYGLDGFTNRYAEATDTYIFKGLEKETYHPQFTYHGFRYAEITGLTEEPQIDDLYACAVHTAFDGEAVFKTDNNFINKLYNNAVWSIKSNNLSYSSDCAARDERTPCAMDLMTYQDAALYQRVLGGRLGVRYEHFTRVQLAGRQNRLRHPRRRLCGLSVQSVRIGPERR